MRDEKRVKIITRIGALTLFLIKRLFNFFILFFAFRSLINLSFKCILEPESFGSDASNIFIDIFPIFPRFFYRIVLNILLFTPHFFKSMSRKYKMQFRDVHEKRATLYISYIKVIVTCDSCIFLLLIVRQGTFLRNFFTPNFTTIFWCKKVDPCQTIMRSQTSVCL